MFGSAYFGGAYFGPTYFGAPTVFVPPDPSLSQLNARQLLLYTSTADIYRPGEPVDPVTKKRNEKVWVKVLTGVRCRYVYTQNDDDPTGVGRTRRRSALDEDLWNAWVGLDIRSGDAIVDTTLNPNGHTVHRVMGAPRRIPDQGNRHANKLVCQLFQDEKLAKILGVTQ